jgi:hypothetical protein
VHTHQPHRPITEGRIDLFGMTYILPTQKDAASNLGRLNPFVGIGKPGPLKHVGAGAWSRRIDNTHRLVF